MARLKRGAAQLLLLQYAWSDSSCRPRKRGEPVPEWTSDLTFEYVSDICGCTIQMLRLDLKDGHERKLWQLQDAGVGRFRLRLLHAGWAKLPDYEAPKPQAITEEPEVEDETLDPETVKEGTVRLVKAPVLLRPGRASRVIKVNTGVRTCEIRNELEVGVSIDPVVESGRLVTVLRQAQGKSGGGVTSTSNGINHLASDKERALSNPSKAENPSIPIAPARQVNGFNKLTLSNENEHSNSYVMPPWISDGPYTRFIEAYRETGKPLIDQDFTDAWPAWKKLLVGERLAAIRGIEDRVQYRIWDDPTYVLLPKNYLKNGKGGEPGEWSRAVEPRKKAAGRVSREQEVEAIRRLNANEL